MSVTDRYAAIACDHCGEKIDEGLELAAKIEYRQDGKAALHPACVAEYDAEADCDECNHPLRIHETRYGCNHERDRWITGHDGTEGLVATRCGCPRDAQGNATDQTFAGMRQDRKAASVGGYPF